MTYELYWESDPMLVVAYRKADEMRRRRRNQELWIQGCYIYDALCCASPLFHAFAKAGTTPHPYLKEPYPLTEEEKNEREKKRQQARLEQAKRSFSIWASRTNRMIREKEGG